MPAGDYPHRVRFERPTYTENVEGQPVITWPAASDKPHAVLWCKVMQLGGGQAFDANQQQAETTYEIRTRSSTASRAIDSSFRAVFNGHTLQIGAAHETEFRGREVVIIATEKTEAG